MQIAQTENELIIRESPGCLWIFGLLFALVGGAFVYGALGGFVDYGRQEWWVLALAFLMGSIGVAAGVWIIYGAPLTKVVIDRFDTRVFITRYGLFGRRESAFSFAEIEEFCLIEERDDEGDAVWFLGMSLTSGETFKISSLASHDERFKRNFAFQSNAFMGKALPSAETLFELADESLEEIG